MSAFSTVVISHLNLKVTVKINAAITIAEGRYYIMHVIINSHPTPLEGARGKLIKSKVCPGSPLEDLNPHDT